MVPCLVFDVHFQEVNRGIDFLWMMDWICAAHVAAINKNIYLSNMVSIGGFDAGWPGTAKAYAVLCSWRVTLAILDWAQACLNIVQH